jgi:arachidonate 15-lipoxygenase
MEGIFQSIRNLGKSLTEKLHRHTSNTRKRLLDALLYDESMATNDGEHLAYNYSYLAPLAMPDHTITNNRYFEFEIRLLVLVGIRVVQALLNQLAIRHDGDDAKRARTVYGDLETAFTSLLRPEGLDSVVRGVDYLLKAQADLTVLFINDAILKVHPDVLEKLYSSLMALGKGDREKAKNLLLGFSSELQSLVLRVSPDTPQRVTSLDDYRRLFALIPLPPVADHFQDDDYFASLRVSGCNPVVLRRLDRAIDDFALSLDAYRHAIGSPDDTLERAIAERRAFYVDYSVFASIVHGTWPEWQKYVWPTIGLFAVPPLVVADGAQAQPRRLKAIAIRITLDGRHSVYTPQDGERWLMAKTAFQVADGNYHESVSHLGQTHLVSGAFAVSVHNALRPTHPIRQLLSTHFRGTWAINDLARLTLIAPNGTVDSLLGGTIDSDRVVAAFGNQLISHHVNHSFLPNALHERGVGIADCDLPVYPYRDCALQVWDTILHWCSEYTAEFYAQDAAIEADHELQQWLREMMAHTGARFADIGEQPGPALRTRAYLNQLLTMIIFTASAQHAAVNFPQFDIMSYAPAVPLAAYSTPALLADQHTNPAATSTDAAPQLEWLRMLPPTTQAIAQLNTLFLLGSIHYTRLGDYQPSLTQGKPNIDVALNGFRSRLQNLDASLRVQYPDYPFLYPTLIPHSINI